MAHSDADSSRRIVPLRPLTSSASALEEPPSWAEVEHRARVRRRLISIGILVALLAAALAVLVWNADKRYRAGKLALEQGRYGAAIADFSAARVLFVIYRDADALRRQAEGELTKTAEAADLERRQRLEVAEYLSAAAALLDKGAYAGALAKLQDAVEVVPGGPLPLDADGQASLDQIVQRLRDGAAKALADARWQAAGLQAAALLFLVPGNDQASRFAARAEEGAALQKKLEAARAAGRRGEWREALRLGNAILKVRADFPGAAAIVADATAALRPKPKPKPSPSATAAPEPTVAPPPAPEPTQPPPP